MFIYSSRKADSYSEVSSQSLPSSSSSPTVPLPPSAPEAAAAASFCVVTENVDLQASNKLCQNQNLENLAACNIQQNNSSSNVGNIYDSIDNVPVAYQNIPASSVPDAATNFSVINDSVYIEPIDSTDDVPTSYMSMSASSPPPRSTLPLPSPPEAAAAASFSADIQTGSTLNHKSEDINDRQNNSGGNLGNVYDAIEDVPSAYQNLLSSGSHSAPPDETAAAASVSVDANNVYIPPDNSTKDVPCVYQIEPNTKRSAETYANPLYDVSDLA